MTIVDSLTLDGEQVRSSEIRRRIAAGDLLAAERMLGRPAAATGVASQVGEGTLGVAFDLPVVLPPAGRRRVLLEQPWSGVTRPKGRGRPAEAVIGGDGELLLEGAPEALPGPGERVRVVFEA